ncbi:MAG TPA: metal ABC transporter ATP-binding protein [Candidatus Eremiobacteraceae bacterium]|nr:metal ABC transporter ATP-binding protein [Candidatus Eremiobacteraceae bacterium]
MKVRDHHDHTHVAPQEVAAPPDHSHAVAPGAAHLHVHGGHPDRTVETSAEKALSLRGVCAGYFGRDVLDAVSFDIDPGEFVGIIGPNGSGKSTLLKVVAGLHPAQCGSISVFGGPPDPRRRIVGYVPQAESVNWTFPVTALDVVLMGRYGKLGVLHRPRKTDVDSARDALAEVGMADRAESQIGELSGGQQQRVFVARALSQDPRLMLLDEPIAGVDATSQHAMFTLLEERQRRGMTIVASTHDLSCVATWFDKVLCLNHRVIAFGAPSEVLNDETLSQTYGSHVLVIPPAGIAAD